MVDGIMGVEQKGLADRLDMRGEREGVHSNMTLGSPFNWMKRETIN